MQAHKKTSAKHPRAVKRATPTTLRTRVSTKGQVVIPKELRDELGMKDGDILSVSADGDGLRLTPLAPDVGLDASQVSGILKAVVRAAGRPAPVPESEWQQHVDEMFRRQHISSARRRRTRAAR